MQSISNNIYYQPNEYQFHDSGIVEEDLSDETGSMEEGLNNQTDDNDTPKKPKPSYLVIIAKAILQSPNRMMQLYEIYDYFQRKYRYFAEDINKSWKNSVRHNLSLNDCFIKAGRGRNGKGHYWRIHPSVEQDFEQGRFQNRRRYRQQIHQVQIQTSSIHHSPYEHQSVPSFYSPYYICSPSPPSYQTMYSTPNSSTEISPISYPSYDPYSTSYYPAHYYSMTPSYTSPNESINFDV